MFNTDLRMVLEKLDNIRRQLGSQGRSGSQTVPLHKFNRLEDIGDGGSTIGVCLWGPPGCGKSSAMTHIKEILKDSNPIYVNSDDWVEFLASTYFPVSYKKNCDEKREVYRTGSRKPIQQFLIRELGFKEKIRSMTLQGLKTMADELEENSSILPPTLYDLIHIYIVKLGHEITMEEWSLFHADHPQLFRSEPNPGFLLYDIVPWWAKTNEKHFVLETTGRRFNENFHRDSFAGVLNIMYIPFVSDLNALKDRVRAREEQFGNPDNDFVEEVFQNAYGANLVRVLDSGIYDQIVVQGNHKKNYVMMSLEKTRPDDSNRCSYILVKEFANNMEEALYIKELLRMLYIPEELQAQNQLVYDADTNKWSVISEHP